jgi:DNA polymerase I-like protein with 3'-5' exonuclease and polymerase domains
MINIDVEFGCQERSRAKATLLQQMDADILRMEFMRLHTKFRDLGMKGRIVTVIHDAVYVEAPSNEEQRARYWMKTIMEDAVDMLIVSLEVDIESFSG